MFAGFYWFIKGLIYSLLLGLIVWCHQYCIGLSYSSINICLINGLFIRDCLSFLMVLLVVTIVWAFVVMGLSSMVLYLSMISAIIVSVVNNALLFWFFYELSIISALYLLVKNSLYPERYVASWYMIGYVLLSGVPLLICILLVSLSEGGFNILCWGNDNNELSLLYFIMVIMFCTKIPLVPFHSWLPIVHAEASSPVSVVLSGYIMKLGIVGVLRVCSSWLVNNYVSSVVAVIFMVSLVFMCWAYAEVDSKRWLAVLSLLHIVVSVVILIFGEYNTDLISLLYLYGHGCSVSAMFIFIWWGYSCILSRSWLILSTVFCSVIFIQVVSVMVFMGASSFPPTLQFFGEVGVAVISLLSQDFVLILSAVMILFGGSLLGLMVLGLVINSLLDSNGIIVMGINGLLVYVIYFMFIGLLMFMVV
ncbi:NADH dehydrogenase subunit 4 (mitochondrion) [Schistosoma mansoni]|uniref:NADH-ubiquinone oxidoreductase chain 4 n=3 Tax=Schistosoma mansoni TaxID=6183 RepID=Q9MD45_SCHMA|nr:NADH dehydrogenase subunit 4 [Schistosoma mansoni]AAF29454.2 NADH dehydrogenase 4 [Schistosoma mansoni]AAG13166.2 NADH dehydrogenase subunit 4 [Schistosoma mansoni]|eukprot:NP_066214.2 NADH dehydrogenase subunit 4 (mitochondrion) [Schistosoma mansoni]